MQREINNTAFRWLDATYNAKWKQLFQEGKVEVSASVTDDFYGLELLLKSEGLTPLYAYIAEVERDFIYKVSDWLETLELSHAAQKIAKILEYAQQVAPQLMRWLISKGDVHSSVGFAMSDGMNDSYTLSPNCIEDLDGCEYNFEHTKVSLTDGCALWVYLEIADEEGQPLTLESYCDVGKVAWLLQSGELDGFYQVSVKGFTVYNLTLEDLHDGAFIVNLLMEQACDDDKEEYQDFLDTNPTIQQVIKQFGGDLWKTEKLDGEY
jgi:hypothetical protein